MHSELDLDLSASFPGGPPYFVTIDTFRYRLTKIFCALLEESWLPLSYRSAVTEVVTDMKVKTDQGDRKFGGFSGPIHSLVLLSHSFGAPVINSKVVSEIRRLDLELEGFSLRSA